MRYCGRKGERSGAEPYGRVGEQRKGTLCMGRTNSLFTKELRNGELL